MARKTNPSFGMRAGWLIGALLASATLLSQVAAHVPLATNQVIEIDGGANGANVFREAVPGTGALNPAASLPANPVFVDWVKDPANSDSQSSYGSNDVAIGVIPGQTGAVGGKGDWYGVRIVDRVVNGVDQSIFLTGGKEEDTTTWNPGPGSIGSDKYDISEAILASNLNSLFIRTHRVGNNGTTSYRIEFNKLGTEGGLIPVRTADDRMIVFTVQGSTAPTFAFYKWVVDNAMTGAGHFEVAAAPAGTPPAVASTNLTNSTPAPSWGYVSNGNGTWSLGNMPRYTDAEGAVPLTLLIGTDAACGKSFYVQIRTNSSAQINSDLKDLTRIFKLSLGGPAAQANLNTGCLQQFTYDATGSHDSQGGTNLTYHWDFTVDPTKASLSNGGLIGNAATGVYSADTNQAGPFTVDVGCANGVNSATIQATLTVSEGSCTDVSSSQSVTVYRQLGVVASLSGDCTNTLTYDATPSGGQSPYTYAWVFQRIDGMTLTTVGTSATKNGSTTAPTDGLYQATVTITDAAGCTATNTSSADPAALPINPSIVKTDATSTGTGVILTATLHLIATDTFKWQVQDASTSTPTVFTNISGADNTNPYTYTGFKTDDPTPTAVTFTLSGTTYKGLKYEVNIRLNATRTLNGQTCTELSNVLKVSYIEAADPVGHKIHRLSVTRPDRTR